FEKNAGFHRFVREMIAFRKRHPALRRREFFRNPTSKERRPDITWHGVELNKADFRPESNEIAIVFDGAQTGREPDDDIYIAFNAGTQDLQFEIPDAPDGGTWRKVVDTARNAPSAFTEECHAPTVKSGSRLDVSSRSMVILVAAISEPEA